MKNPKNGLGGLAVFVLACIPFSAIAQTLHLDGNWAGNMVCPGGPVQFTLAMQGAEGTLRYTQFQGQKPPAESFPVTARTRWQDMDVTLFGPSEGPGGIALRGKLLADDTIDVFNPSINRDYCESFRLVKETAKGRAAKAPSFDAQGLVHQNFFMLIMQGEFAALGISAGRPEFNGLFGAYLYAYARQCAANPDARPEGFVEMTNLQCVQQGITTTYYRNGSFSESAPYCTQWKDVPSGFHADPKLWEAKKTLDDLFLGDTYRNLFAARKGLGLGMSGTMTMPNPAKIAEAVAERAKDMEALIEKNGCDSPGLMRFQENLRLFSLNRPFGIRPDGALAPAIPVPAAGTRFEDPDWAVMLEELIKGEARSWQVNKYVLRSIGSPTIASRDDLGRPLELSADYRYNGMSGFSTGTMRVTFFEGYPQCLYFWDHPKSCRTPDRTVVSKYVHGIYSSQHIAAAAAAQAKTGASAPTLAPGSDANPARSAADAAQARRMAREKAAQSARQGAAR